MKTYLHILTTLSFMAVPVVAEATPVPSSLVIEMCGDHVVAPIPLPLSPQPINQNHCNKACHAGCLRKRKSNQSDI